MVFQLRSLLVVCLMLGTLSTVSAEPVIVNVDFENDTLGFTVWPGYVGNGNPETISGWTGEGGRGINPVNLDHDNPAPFRDNGNNDTHVAFLQGTSSISQTVGGFTVGSEYVLTLEFNSRNCCGDAPVGFVFLNDVLAADTIDVFGGDGGTPPVGADADWYPASIPFTATTEDIVVKIATAPAAGGDSTLVVDNVAFSVVPEPNTCILMLLGLLGFISAARRRK